MEERTMFIKGTKWHACLLSTTHIYWRNYRQWLLWLASCGWCAARTQIFEYNCILSI